MERKRTYGVWAVRSSTSIFGPAQSWCKENGKPLEFDSKADAENYAKEANEHTTANVRYYVKEKEPEPGAVRKGTSQPELDARSHEEVIPRNDAAEKQNEIPGRQIPSQTDPLVEIRSAVHSNYAGMVAMLGADNRVYLGREERCHYQDMQPSYYDNQDGSLCFVCDQPDMYYFLYGEGWAHTQTEMLERGLTLRQYEEFARLQNGVLAQFTTQREILFAGQPFQEYIKEQIRVKLIRVRCMNSMAKERGVVLGREEKNETAKAAEQYFDGLTEEQKSQYDITEDKVNQMFTEFAIASKLYNDVTSLMDIEVSSDDARVINIQYIVTDSKEEIDKAYAELNEGNSFFAIAKKYNADGEYEYELRRGEMAKAFEDTAYLLSTGQTSGIVEADGRFYIIRCTSDNDKAKTEVNKSSILEKKKLEAFNDKFEQYESSKYVEINKDEWNKLKVSSAPSFNVRFEDLFNSITIN